MASACRADISGFQAFMGFLHSNPRDGNASLLLELRRWMLSAFRQRHAEPIRHFDIDFECCECAAPLQLHLNLVGIEIHMLGDDRKYFLADNTKQVGLVASRALVRQQNLQSLARNRRGAATPQEIEQVHAALRPNSLSNRRLRSLGTLMARFSPRSLRAAST